MTRAVSLLAAVACLALGCTSPATDSLDHVEQASGGGTNPDQLGCEGLRANFVDDGVRLEAAQLRYLAATRATEPKVTSLQGENGRSWNGISKDKPFKGQIWPRVATYKVVTGQTIDQLNPGIPAMSIANCLTARDQHGSAAYDACVEIFTYGARVRALAHTWDNNKNGKRCFEGPSTDSVVSPEFGYCDNECGFNDESCDRCEVRLADGTPHAFVCKSRASALDAIGGFCRNVGAKCQDFDPNAQCTTAPGKSFAGGNSTALGGETAETFEVSLMGYLGASEKVQLKAGVAAGQSLTARGSIEGKLGYTVTQKVGGVMTPSGIGQPGLRVQCTLGVTGVGSIAYDYSAGVGGDFIFASGEATVDAGGRVALTKAYAKTSPEFSAAGQTKDTILKQCLNNYVMSWVGVELQNWVDQYSGLSLVKKAISRVRNELGMDASYKIEDTSHVYCLFPSYDGASGYRTGGVWVYFEDEVRIDFGFMQHLGLDSLWPDSYSGKLVVPNDGEAIRPYMRELKAGTLSGDRLVSFFNNVVAPASKSHGNAKWHVDYCWWH